MKIIKYILCTRVNRGTEENPIYEDVLSPTEIRCMNQAQYDISYPIAEQEAMPGTVRVSGEFEEDNTITQLDIIEAQLTYTAMMTDTLLEV